MEELSTLLAEREEEFYSFKSDGVRLPPAARAARARVAAVYSRCAAGPPRRALLWLHRV